MYGYDVEVRGNTTRYSKKLYDLNGNHVGTISISKPTKKTKKKKKTALYNFKQISSQVLNAKTSSKASQVSKSIRIKIGLLKKQLKNSDYDEEELLRAILHAEMVQKACEKKKDNLEMEERAERGIKSGEEVTGADEEAPVEDEEIKELEQEEFRALLEKVGTDSGDGMEMTAEDMMELSEDMMEMAEETAEFDESLDEMAEALSGSMSPEDLKQLKIKHRSDEAREILKADLKYLKALFEKLQSEKENAGKASFTGGGESGVSLSLGGTDLPVVNTGSQNIIGETGGTFDAEV
ncbi:MAG: hypothetical protein K5989_03615 [Lachnospiraceae bacterium]|nr:hypothetical protein [Lachnospiraceae bacterium]